MRKQSFLKARQSILTEQAEIQRVLEYLDSESFEKAVDALVACKKVVTCASGTSGIAAKKFAHSLCCIEKDAAFLVPSEAVHGGLGCVDQGDLVVIVSRGGKTEELLPIVEVCVKKGAHLMALTENTDSPISRTADITIKMQIEKEADPLNIMATSSFLVTVALFDALLAAMIEETGYRLEQFSLIHPGGAVGQQLNSSLQSDKNRYN